MMDAQETRRLLELAARAAGYQYAPHGGYIVVDGVPGNWNPLTGGGDALRLACDLSIDILHRVVGGQRVEVIAPGVPPIIEYCTEDTRAAATRLAVLRAAAAVGEMMNAVP